MSKIKPIKLHWYCFTYLYGTITESIYRGLSKRKITKYRIDNNKKNLKVINDSALLISCSYLGYMTIKEFTGKNDE